MQDLDHLYTQAIRHHNTMWVDSHAQICDPRELAYTIYKVYWPNFLPSFLQAMVKAGKCLIVVSAASALL